jgi:hypothetical protein
MPKLTFVMTMDGNLPAGIKATLAGLLPTFAGKKVIFSISEAKDKRSLNQNDFYRTVILPHVREMMYDLGDARSLDAWHEVLLLSFSPLVSMVALNGDPVMLPKRTRAMEKPEMTAFITAIIAECADRGYPVTDRRIV